MHSFKQERKKPNKTNQKTKTAESDSTLPVYFGVSQHGWKENHISIAFVVSFAQTFHLQLLQEGVVCRNALVRESQPEVSSRFSQKPSPCDPTALRAQRSYSPRVCTTE